MGGTVCFSTCSVFLYFSWDPMMCSIWCTEMWAHHFYIWPTYIACCCVAAVAIDTWINELSFIWLFSLQLITDVNIAVAVEAIQAIGNLARGLRTHFSGSSRFLLPVLLVSSVFHQLLKQNLSCSSYVMIKNWNEKVSNLQLQWLDL